MKRLRTFFYAYLSTDNVRCSTVVTLKTFSHQSIARLKFVVECDWSSKISELRNFFVKKPVFFSRKTWFFFQNIERRFFSSYRVRHAPKEVLKAKSRRSGTSILHENIKYFFKNGVLQLTEITMKTNVQSLFKLPERVYLNSEFFSATKTRHKIQVLFDEILQQKFSKDHSYCCTNNKSEMGLVKSIGLPGEAVASFPGYARL